MLHELVLSQAICDSLTLRNPDGDRFVIVTEYNQHTVFRINFMQDEVHVVASAFNYSQLLNKLTDYLEEIICNA